MAYDRLKDPRFAPIRPRHFVGYANERIKKAMDTRRCVLCTGHVAEFRDALSEKEFEISGMCQSCQDKLFG